MLNWISTNMVEQTRVPVEKTTDLPQVTDKLIILVLIGNDYTGSSKSNYNMITTMMALEVG
jgi:hypothetical protein